VTAAREVDNPKRGLFPEVLTYFVSAANAGMFASPPFHPARAWMKATTNSDPMDGLFKATWEGSQVTIGAYKILLQMVTQSHFGHAPLQSFGLISIDSDGRTAGIEEVLASEYPTRPANVPFAMDIAEDIESASVPAIRIEFSRALTSEEFGVLEQLLADWHCLILFGGYRDSFEHMTTSPLRPGKLYLSAPNVAEHVLYGFRGAPVAYDALINMLVKLHSDGWPVERVEIE
jgi:hypothetical protein